MLRDVEDSITVVIASGSTSASFPLGGYAWGSVQLPAAFTGTALTFNYSHDGSNWTAVPVEGNEVNPETVTANGTYRIPAYAFAAKYCQIVSGSSEAAARTITVFLRS